MMRPSIHMLGWERFWIERIRSFLAHAYANEVIASRPANATIKLPAGMSAGGVFVQMYNAPPLSPRSVRRTANGRSKCMIGAIPVSPFVRTRYGLLS